MHTLKLRLLLMLAIPLAACNHGEDRGVLIAGLMGIDVATGDRTQFSVFEGTDRAPRGIVFDPVADRIYVVTIARLFAVDAGTGIPTLIADADTGAGPDFTFLHAIALDPAKTRAYVFDDPGIILAVDTVTGIRLIVSDATTGTGPPFAPGRGAAMVHDVATDTLVVAAPAFPGAGDAIVAVTPATGDRTVLSAATVGTGPAFSFLGGVSIAADFALGRVFVAQGGAILEVDLATGDRTLLYDGPPAQSAVAADIPNSRLLHVSGGALLAIELPGGASSVLSDAGMGVGPTPAEPRGLEFDGVRGRAIAAAYGAE